VEFILGLAARFAQVTAITLDSDQPEEVLPNGLRCIGLQLYPPGKPARTRELLALLERLAPDRLLLLTPDVPVLRWAAARRINTLPMFFDSFCTRGWRARFGYWQLARVLRKPHFRWIANHSLAAAWDLVRIGVPASKVLPIDWPAFDSPASRPAKVLQPGMPFRLIFVGQVSEAKGVWDLLQAVDRLNGEDGRAFELTIVGKEVGEDLEGRARTLRFSKRVRFAGLVAHTGIVDLMNAHDAVVVPSRHEYPEGLPMTIFEAFCSRSPLIASDHPMFAMKLRDGSNAMIFRAADTGDLARVIHRLGNDAATYAALSANAVAAAEQHFCPLKYHMAIEGWLAGAQQGALLGPYALSCAEGRRE
jgi:glycosyltransferase involved in cell wall biosynthesis